MRHQRWTYALVPALCFALGGCPDDGAAEEAGESIDEAAEDTGEALEDAVDETEDAIEDADSPTKGV